jgi:hypothetical protein
MVLIGTSASGIFRPSFRGPGGWGYEGVMEASETSDDARRERILNATFHVMMERGYADRKSTRLNSSHNPASRMPSSA